MGSQQLSAEQLNSYMQETNNVANNNPAVAYTLNAAETARQTAEAQQQQLAAQVAQLQQQLQAAAAQAQAQPPIPPSNDLDALALAEAMQQALRPLFESRPKDHHIKLAAPETFDGSHASKLLPFLASLRLHIETQPAAFKTEITKISFAISYLRGTPLQEVLPELEKPQELRSLWMQSYPAFTQHLLTNYGQVDKRTAAIQKMNKLEQKGSCAKYWVEFNTLAQLTGWDDQAHRDKFYKGLKSEIKDALVLHPIEAQDTLTRLKDTAIRQDNRLHERKMEKNEHGSSSSSNNSTSSKSNNHRSNNNSDRSNNKKSDSSVQYVTPPTGPNNPSAGPSPMELDAANVKTRFAPLTDDQKKYRREHNLCLYCGDKNHKLDTCPKRSNNKSSNNRVSNSTPNNNRPASTAAVTFTTSGPTGIPPTPEPSAPNAQACNKD